eukprot:s136_g8.t1
MKWNHRALLRDDFLSEWQARDRALHLAFDLACVDSSTVPSKCSSVTGCAPGLLAPTSTRPSSLRTRRARHLSVGFSDDLELFLGCEDRFKMYNCSFPVEAFACGVSPWSCSPLPRSLVPKLSFVSDDVDGNERPTYTIGKFMSNLALYMTFSNQVPDSSPHVSSLSSSSSQSDDTHRPEPEPPWAPCIWNLLRNEGIVEDEIEGPVVFVTSYFISHTHQTFCDEPRPLRFDVDFRDWNRDVRTVWEDVMDESAPFDIIAVQPPPPHLVFPGTVATVLVQQHMTPTRAAWMTTAVHVADPRTRFYQAAHSSTLAIAQDQVHQLARTFDVCQLRQQQGFGRCTISIGQHTLPADPLVQLHTGLGLTIIVPAPLSDAELESNLVMRIARHRAQRSGDAFDPADPDNEPEDVHPHLVHDDMTPEDATSLMARRPHPFLHDDGRSRSRSDHSVTPSSASPTQSSSPPNWQQTVVFVLDGRSCSLNLPWGDRVHMRTLIAQTLMLYENEIVAMHRVSNQPSDYIENDLQCLLLQRHSDIAQSLTFCIVLFDVEVFEPFDVQPTQLRRFVRWVPSTMTRRSTLRLLGLEQQCTNPLLRCTFWHNNVIIGSAFENPLQIEHGNYIRVLIRNPRCESHPQVYAEAREDVSLLQLRPPVLADADWSRSVEGVGAIDRLAHCSPQVCKDDQIQPILLSFTEAFLNALRLFTQAAEDLPEFPSDPEENLDLHPWVRTVHEAWSAHATLGPGGVERLGRLETWFTDHLSFQRCHFTRMAVLGGDFSHWEHEIRVLWRDRILNGAVLEFHWVEPLPEDAAAQSIGQLILVQRPVRFQRSLVISIYDSGYDRGMAHSAAVVMTDRVDFHAVRSIVDAVNDCPPEHAHNVCALWVGSRQMQPHERFIARHGHALRFLIHRREADRSANMSDLDDPLLRDRIQHLSGLGPLPFPSVMAVLSPGWAQDLHHAFAEYSAIEREDEGPVAYLQTWHLNGLRAPRCQHPRTVRLRSDASSWQRSITDLWDDRLDLRLPFDIYWVEPAPLNSPMQSYIGHIIVLQEPQDAQAALLLTAIHYGDGPIEPHHAYVSEEIDVSDDLGLLQHTACRTSVSRKDAPTPRERLTAAAVAQAQRPRGEVGPTDNVNPPEIVQLHLDDYVPAPVWTTIDCQRLDFQRRQLLGLMPGVPSFCCDWSRCTDSTILAFDSISQWHGAIFRPSSQQAASGVVMTFLTDEGLHFGGFHTAWCWKAPSAPRAETSAVIVGVMWRLCGHYSLWFATHADCRCVDFIFHFDSVYAGRVAQGLCTSELNLDIAKVARSLALWLEQLLWSPPQWLHVKGHSNDPWNDLADTVAGQAIDDSRVTFDVDLVASSCTFDGADLKTQQWLWLFERSLQGRSDAPVLHQLHWKLNSAAPLQSSPVPDLHPFMKFHVHRDSPHGGETFLQLRVATANVLSLYPAQDHASTFLGARAEDLAQQLRHAGIQCVGLQETRFRGNGHVFFEGFHVLSEGASVRGFGGTQFWCAHTLTTPSGSIHIDHSHLRILHGDDRRLVVQLSHPSLRVLFVVLHAPCDDDESRMREWWAQTSAVIPSRFASWTWITLCDSNGRLGSVVSDVVGDFGAEPESMRGSVFHDWLLHHGLRLPQTFEESHCGEHDTWHHASNGQGRIDFIGVSDNVPLDWTSSWVAPDVDLTTVRHDHSCVCADVWFATSCSTSHRRFKSEKLDGERPTWHSDVHSHAALLQAQFRDRVPCSPRDHLRKKHISDATLCLIKKKKTFRCTMQQLRCQWRRHCLAHLFAAWRDPSILATRDDAFISTTFTQLAKAEEDYRVAALRVCFAIREDDRVFYSRLAEETGFIAEHGFHRVWNAIKPVLPKWRHRRKNNMRCNGPDLDDQVRHYCALEGGQEYAYDALLRDCSALQRGQVHDLPLAVSLDQLPSRIDIEGRFQSLTVNRAPGLDGLSPTFLRAFGPDLADDVFQLALKMWLTGHEPVQFKGGLLHSITKKVQSRQVADMRGIMLIDVIGKIMHSLMRQRFLPTLLRWRHPMQLGGFPCCSTMFATQYLRAFHDRAHDLKLSSAVLFLDVKSAFHSMIRQILLGADHRLPDHLCDILQESGCDLDEILQTIREASVAFENEVPLCEQRLLRDAHVFTWFGLTGSSTSFCTSRGSRPGSPLADVAYNALMVHVLTTLHRALSEISLLQQGLCALGLPAPPVTWVDDVAVPIVVSDAVDLEAAISTVACRTIHVFRRSGLILNLKPRKTEVVIAPRGKGAPEFRHDLLVVRLGRIPLPDFGVTLQCVAKYEHLGTIFAADADMQNEVSHRRTRAIQAHRQVARPILRNRHISVQVRLKLFESLVIPVLLHGAGNWKLLSARQFQSLHAVIMSWQRSILQNGFWTSDQLTDFELQCRWRLPSLSLRLAKARLLYAFHCVRDGPSLLLDYVSAVSHMPGSWFTALRQGLRWLSSMDNVFCDPSLADETIENIVSWLHSHIADGPRTVRRLYRRCLLQYHVLGDAFSLHMQLRTTLEDGGIQFGEVPKAAVARAHCVFQCEWCPHSFDSVQKLQVHYWIAHQIVSDERRFVFAGSCLACNRCFWSAARLQQHLRLTYEALAGVRVCGPTSAPIDLAVPSRDAALQLLQRRWEREGFPDQLTEDMIGIVFQFADAQVRQWNPCGSVDPDEVIFASSSFVDEDDMKLWALWIWQHSQLHYQRFTHLDVSYFQRLKLGLIELLDQTPLGRLLAWRRRMDEAFRPLIVDENAEMRVRHEREPLVDPFDFQVSGFDVFRVSSLGLPNCAQVPVTVENGVPTIWILHLFSGRRRRGDCHFWVQCCQSLLSGFAVRILSVDTAIHSQLGNLDRGPYFDMLLRIIRKSFFAAGLTGPPCETFSAARHIQLQSPRQPRPLRSRT